MPAEDPSSSEDEGERPGAQPYAQPQLRAGRAEGSSAEISRRYKAHEDRDSPIRAQLHLGALADAQHGWQRERLPSNEKSILRAPSNDRRDVCGESVSESRARSHQKSAVPTFELPIRANHAEGQGRVFAVGSLHAGKSRRYEFAGTSERKDRRCFLDLQTRAESDDIHAKLRYYRSFDALLVANRLISNTSCYISIDLNILD